MYDAEGREKHPNIARHFPHVSGASSRPLFLPRLAHTLEGRVIRHPKLVISGGISR
jgi:hypothetical protein